MYILAFLFKHVYSVCDWCWRNLGLVSCSDIMSNKFDSQLLFPREILCLSPRAGLWKAWFKTWIEHSDFYSLMWVSSMRIVLHHGNFPHRVTYVEERRDWWIFKGLWQFLCPTTKEFRIYGLYYIRVLKESLHTQRYVE